MSNEVNAFVCAQVRRLRQERRLRVQDMAERSGIPLGSYSCLELGRYRMSLENLFRLLLVLQVEVSEVWPSTIPVDGPVTAQTIREAIKQAEEQLPERLTIDLLLRAVAGAHGVTVEELKGPSRRRDLTDARVQAARIVRRDPHITLNELARALNRDPSSLCHAIRRREQP